jgi:hypothetical protein
MRSTARPIVLLVAGGILGGCVYEADVEPAGRIANRRSAIVGAWVCGWDNQADWASLFVGWNDDGYLLTFHPVGPPEPDADEAPWVVSVRPRRVGASEIWSAWSDHREPSELKFSFARLEQATSAQLVVATLGDGLGLPARLHDISPKDLAALIANSKSTVSESRLICRRPAVPRGARGPSNNAMQLTRGGWKRVGASSSARSS